MKTKSEKYRKYYFCPIEGCSSKAIRKMSNHLITVHHIMNKEERMALLEQSKKKGQQKPKAQYVCIDIRTYLQPSQHIVTPKFTKTHGSTRHLKRYTLGEMKLLQFR